MWQTGNADARVHGGPAVIQSEPVMIHCVMSGLAPGAFLEKLIETHCRTWRVQENGSARVTTDDRLNLSDHISSPALSAS